MHLSKFIEIIVSLRFGRNVKDQPANPPDLFSWPHKISSKWLTMLCFNTLRNEELTAFQGFSNNWVCKFLDQKVSSDHGRKYVDLTLAFWVFHFCSDGYLIHLRALHNKFKGSLRLCLFQVIEPHGVIKPYGHGFQITMASS